MMKLSACLILCAVASQCMGKVTLTISPGAAEVGQTDLVFTLSAQGTEFSSTAVALWNGSPLQTIPAWNTAQSPTGTTFEVTLLPTDLNLESTTPKAQLAIYNTSDIQYSVHLPIYPTCGAVVNSATNRLGQLVNVYSNGRNTTSIISCGEETTPWHPVITSPYGEAYQCVELVRRYYDGLVSPQYSPLTNKAAWRGDAVTHWTTYAAKGLVRFSNGDSSPESSPPIKDDILVFQKIYTYKDPKTGQTKTEVEGHVAVVSDISSTTLSIVEENWDEYGGRNLQYNPTKNTVSVGASEYLVVGWLRSAKRSAPPIITSVSPTSIPVGPFKLVVTGNNFASGASVNFSGVPLETTYVSATQLTATGTATLDQVGSIPITVETPGSTVSNSISVMVVNISGANSGSTAIITGTVNGQAVDKAYVPIPSVGRVAVVNVDSSVSTTALIKSIIMPPGYLPNATAANSVTQQVVWSVTALPTCRSSTPRKTFSPLPSCSWTQFANFSGGRAYLRSAD